MCLKSLLLIFISFTFLENGIANPSSYGTTNYEINQSIKRLEKNIRVLENKLSRHEFREAQVADFSTKTLNALTAEHSTTRKNMQNLLKQISSMEDRMLSFDSLITMIDERQRKKLDSLGKGIDRLLIASNDFALEKPLPPPPGENLKVTPTIEKDLKKILRRVNVIEGSLAREVKKVNNEVKIVGESLGGHMKQMSTRQDRVWNGWNVCQKEQIQSITEASTLLSQAGVMFAKDITEAKQLFSKEENECNKLNTEIVGRFDHLDKTYQNQEKVLSSLNQGTQDVMKEQKDDLEAILKEIRSEKSLNNDYFSGVFDSLKELGKQSKKHIGDLETTLKNILKENSRDIRKRVDSIATVLDDKSLIILNALDDTAAMSENMQNSMTENFDDLTKDVRALKKVEQVMLSTADAVLDTKRSIEFGIQQVILELSDTVKNSGKNIDLTLSDHITNISFAILKNQTSALTNMTSKMEKEISLVWRQIGIMYNQIAQSVDLLGELKSTTSQQMNASLYKVDNMDGTVGAINNKVADVEDNLNYLLGRLTLVVSEFSQMKTGVGSELDRLREMAQEFSSGDIVEYEINRKRSISNENQVHNSDDRKQ